MNVIWEETLVPSMQTVLIMMEGMIANAILVIRGMALLAMVSLFFMGILLQKNLF